MSGLAEILLSRGFGVSGSDQKENSLTQKLQKLGADVYLGHDEKNLAPAVQTVVFSGAVQDDNPELAAARQRKIKVISRSQLLGELMDQKAGIAITGTHGKTTTSSLLSLIFEREGLKPTILIGGEVRSIGGNARDGEGKYLIAEACEFQRAFLDLHPQIGVITNIEADHLDYYKDLAEIEEAFLDFTTNIKADGFLVAGIDSPSVSKILSRIETRTITYGISSEEAEWKASNIQIQDDRLTFEVSKRNQNLGQFSLQIPGTHNIQNALAAIIVSLECGIKLRTIKEVISNFAGAVRRMEFKGERNGILVFDDYAHHPSEIQSSLAGLKSFYPDKKIYCVFQPHQHSRTKLLLKDFASSFKEAEMVIIPKIYAVRDTLEDIASVSGEDLVEEIIKNKKEAHYLPDFEDCVDFLEKTAKSGDIILTMGAGPVNQVAETYLNKVKEEINV